MSGVNPAVLKTFLLVTGFIAIPTVIGLMIFLYISYDPNQFGFGNPGSVQDITVSLIIIGIIYIGSWIFYFHIKKQIKNG